MTVGQAYLPILFFCYLASQGKCLSAENNLTYPQDWGEQSKLRLNNSDCPVINGRYKNDGYIYKLINGEENGSAANGAYKITPSFLIPTNKVPNKNIEGKSNDNLNPFFIQNQTEVGFMVTTTEFRDSTNLVSYIFDIANDEFKCENGWIVFRERKYSGGSEWSSSRSSNVKEFTILKDGSLLIKSTEVSHTTRMLMLEFAKKSETITYGKFAKDSY